MRSINSVVGMTTRNAKKLCKKLGFRFRVTEEDGQHFMLTMDFVPDRINVVVENDIVVSYTIG